MKRYLVVLSVLSSVFIGASSSFGYQVNLYVDAAPNIYGSPDYASWEAAAFSAAANGSFVNMANGFNSVNAGTTNFAIQDEVVYSFGDLGKRLTWIYWVPGATINDLKGNFELSLFNYWGNEPALDFYGTYSGSTWLEPTQWIDYDADNNGTIDGVIGTAGAAWWGAYGVNTQQALDADLAKWGLVGEEWVLTAKLGQDSYSINSHRDPVPEPSTMVFFSLGLACIFGVSWKRTRERLSAV